MANAGIATIIIIITVSAIGWLNNQKIKWIQLLLNWFPAILFAYVIPALITQVGGLDLSSVYLHSLSRNWIIPFAIMMVMSALSFPQLKKVGIRPIMLFISGSLAIAVLPTILVLLSKFISPETYSLFYRSTVLARVSAYYWKLDWWQH
jgi:anaerobic C4-dicarboxylate transporter